MLNSHSYSIEILHFN